MQKILFLASQMYGSPGGVQTFMRRIREVLHAHAVAHGTQVDCVSLNDVPGREQGHSRPVSQTSLRACSGSKPRFLSTITGLALRERYDVAIVGHLGLGPAAYWLRALGGLRSSALVLHGMEAWAELNAAEALAAWRANTIIATTAFTAGVFSAVNRISPNRFRILPLSVSETAEDIQVRMRAARPASTEFRLLTVARLDPLERDKGIHTIIAAIPAIREQVPGAQLVIVGDGPDRDHLASVIEAAGLSASISMPGWVPEAELQRLYGECDVFVLPSRQEGFGLAFIEAMSHGKPCIGGKHGGAPEVIRDGRDGLLVRYGDTEKLAEYCIRLGADRDYRERLGSAALESARQRYSYDAFSRTLMNIIDELASPAVGTIDESEKRTVAVGV